MVTLQEGGFGVGGLRGSCGNQEDWIEMLTYKDSWDREGEKNYNELQDDKSRRSDSNECQCCVKLFEALTTSYRPMFYLSLTIKESRMFLQEVLHSLMLQITRVFQRTCSRMLGIQSSNNCRPFHSKATDPFITSLFNQVAVTKLGSEPVPMLITSHLLSIWLLYCQC